MFTRRLTRALVLGTLVALLATPMVFADDISNNVDATVDATLEVMNLTVGGANGSTTLAVFPTNGDGKNGCNLTGSTTLVTAVASSSPSVATVSPSSITWTACGNTPVLTVTPIAVGTSTVSLSLTSNNTTGTFNLAPASFTVNVAAAPPSDSTAPSISYVLSPVSPDGTNGWYRTNITLTWTVTENESPLSLIKTGCVDQNITADQAETTYSCSATSDGGSAGPISVTIKRDDTAPSVAYTSAAPAPNGAGWNNTDVTATFTATDNLSGFGDPVSLTTTDTATSSGEGPAVAVDSPAFTDNAGNTALAGAASQPFKIDLTDPSVAITSPADGTSTIASVITVSGTASDSPSGIASVTVNGGAATYDSLAGTFSRLGVTLACGPNTITAVATDVADRTSTSPSITVNRICFSGLQYYQPLDQSTGAAPIINKGKYGRVIPTKVTFSILGGDVVTDAVAQANGWTLQIGVNSVTCSGGAASDAVEVYADAGSSAGGTNLFRWDVPGQQWIYNLDTKAPAGVTMAINSCYRLDVYVSDGTNKVKISTTTYAIFQPIK